MTLDGVDLRQLDEADPAPAVVMVTQENFLFSGTVADNIRVRPARGDQQEQVVAAAGRSARTTSSRDCP